MAEPLSLFLVAAEPSGDELGASLCRELEAIKGRGAIRYSGVGGPRMAAYGVPQPFDINELSVLGLVEGLRAYPRVIQRANELAQKAQETRIDAAVLIDSWGFTLRVAQRLRRQSPEMTIIKYVGPQVWASRAGRARALAKVADEVLTLQPFEPPYFERAGMRATFVGHPTLDSLPHSDAEKFRNHYQLNDRIVIVCLFGSRMSEWTHIGPVILETVRRLHKAYGDRLAFIAPVSPSLAVPVRAAFADLDQAEYPIILVDEPEKYDAFAAGDMAIACSGTVVTQLAAFGLPTLVTYKLSAVNYAIVRLYANPPHVSLVNMALSERAFPEFIQHDATPERLCEAASAWIESPDVRAKLSQKGLEAVRRMRGEGGAARRAAEAVLSAIKRGPAAV